MSAPAPAPAPPPSAPSEGETPSPPPAKTESPVPPEKKPTESSTEAPKIETPAPEEAKPAPPEAETPAEAAVDPYQVVGDLLTSVMDPVSVKYLEKVDAKERPAVIKYLLATGGFKFTKGLVEAEAEETPRKAKETVKSAKGKPPEPASYKPWK